MTDDELNALRAESWQAAAAAAYSDKRKAELERDEALKANSMLLKAASDMEEQRDAALAERDRLQRILDSRPAINTGLLEAYIEWTQGVYLADMGKAVGQN
jgi:hypothetical protein